MADTLKEIAIKYSFAKGKRVTDKDKNGYIDIYEKYFSEFRNKENNILEIGVWSGASLKIWSEYFENSHVMGLDIPHELYPASIFPYRDEATQRKLISFINNASLFLGDQGDTTNLQQMINFLEETTKKNKFDIIIDDGSHFQYDIMNSFGFLFPHLNSGGLYIVEDICSVEDLEAGSQWWGHSEEVHHHRPNLRSDEEWLAGKSIDVNNSVDATFKRTLETNVFFSKYLTEEQNGYINDNINTINYVMKDDLPCKSNLAIIRKN